MKFFVIIAICLGTWAGTAFGASCTPSSTAPSNYTLATTYDYSSSACAYDGTVIELPTDKCATITYKCSSTNNNQTAMAVSNGTIPALSGVSGKYCWCGTNNKYFYFTTIGTDDTMCSSGCLSACTNVITNNSGLRTNLGCD